MSERVGGGDGDDMMTQGCVCVCHVVDDYNTTIHAHIHSHSFTHLEELRVLVLIKANY